MPGLPPASALLLLTLVTTSLAQDTAATSPAPRARQRMTTQWGAGVSFGLSPGGFGLDARLYIPISAVRGLRSVTSLGLMGVSNTEEGEPGEMPLVISTNLAYNVLSFSRVNSGLYARLGVNCDMRSVPDGYDPDLGVGIGAGLQSDIGLFGEIGHVFSALARTQVTLGVTKEF